MYETNEIITSFKDELDVDFSIPVESGQYVVITYELTNFNSIFSYISNLGFPDKFPLSEAWFRTLNTEPQSQVSLKKVEDKLDISTSIIGAGIHIIVAEKI